MKKILMLLSMIGLTALFPIHAEISEDSEGIGLNKRVSGMKYAVFLDENCEKPLLDENEEPVVIESNEEGKLESDIFSKDEIYLKQTGTIAGYYLDPVVYNMCTYHEKLPVYEISPEIDYGKLQNRIFEIYDETGTDLLGEFKENEIDGNYLLEAGKKYVMKKKEQEDWCITDDIAFSVPLYPETFQIVVTSHPYGRLHINFESTEADVSTEYRIYEDAECTREAKDIFGEKIRMDLSERNFYELSMAQRKLYLRQEKPDQRFYENTAIVCLSVKNGELTEHTEKLIKPEWKIRLKDEKNGKTLNGRIRISDSEGNFREVNEGDTVQMLPGKSYTLKVCSVEKGYYSGCEQILHVPSEKPEYEIYEIGCRPFFLSIGISDKKTGKPVIGAEFVLLDEKDAVCARFRTDQSVYETSRLSSERSYRLHQIGLADHYLPMQDQQIVIPAFGEEMLKCDFSMEGYVTVHAGIHDSETGGTISEGIIRIFRSDGAEAQDVMHGNPSVRDGKVDICLSDGTYYLQMTDITSKWYLNPEKIVFDVNHADKRDISLSVGTEPVRTSFRVRDPEDNSLDNFTLRILDENGQKIGEMDLAAYETTTDAGISLCSDRKYYYQLELKKGQYTFDEEVKPFILSQMYSQKNQLIEETAEPYVYLTVVETDVSCQAEYELYKDEECTEKSEVLNNVSSGKGGQRQKKWKLRDGIYWLKQVGIQRSYYVQKKPQLIRIDHSSEWKKGVVFENEHVSYTIHSLDEQGNHLSGAVYEILDEKGKVQNRFQTESREVVLSGKWLERGKTYTLHEAEAADGFQKYADIIFKVPEEYNGSVPSLTLKHKKVQKILPLPEKKDENRKISESNEKARNVPVKKKEEKEYSHSVGKTYGKEMVLIVSGLIVGFVVVKKIKKEAEK